MTTQTSSVRTTQDLDEPITDPEHMVGAPPR